MICVHGCFQIGGPWIDVNPSCPTHGSENETWDSEDLPDPIEAFDLHKLRDSLGWTQTELALVLGVHAMTISKSERGRTQLPPSALRFIPALELLAGMPPARDAAQAYVRSGQPLRALGLALSFTSS